MSESSQFVTATIYSWTCMKSNVILEEALDD